MAPIVGAADEFERLYTERFRSIVKPFGLFVKYERDRAAIDIGLHVTQPTESGLEVGNTRVWFQLKGRTVGSLSLEDYRRVGHVSLDLKVDDLRYWFASPEPVYIAVYVEAADEFLAEDVIDIVYRQWGEDIVNPDSSVCQQKTARVSLAESALLTPDRLREMDHHTAIRADGPQFRGRPLGHWLDPLRCVLREMSPEVFTGVVLDLLQVHGYEELTCKPADFLFPVGAHDGAFLSIGQLGKRFEWVHQMTTEIGFGQDHRYEGEPRSYQGHCACLIHADKRSLPTPEGLDKLVATLEGLPRVQQLLVFANDSDMLEAYFGAFHGTFNGDTSIAVRCAPLNLRDLAYNLLTTTSVYLKWRHRIAWRAINYLW